MAVFDSGIDEYVTATYTVEVHFPVDRKGTAHIACVYCPFLSSNERMCQLNKEAVAFPKNYVGAKCPLKEDVIK